MSVCFYEVSVSLLTICGCIVPFSCTGGQVPKDDIPRIIISLAISRGVFMTVTILACIGIVLSLLLLMFNIKQQNKRSVPYNSVVCKKNTLRNSKLLK